MLTRREFVVGMAVAGPVLATASTNTRLPSFSSVPRLRAGDAIGLVAPAGVIEDPLTLVNSAKSIESLGFRPVLGKHVSDSFGYLAGSDIARADDFNTMINDKDVRAIMAIRGGYGSMRILSLVDYQGLKVDPKPVIGYSDITALLVSIHQTCNIPTFHGPVGDSTFSEYTTKWFLSALTKVKPCGELSCIDTPRTLVKGKATGRLVAGNLSLISSLSGTPYAPQLDGAILVVEDVNEDPYKVDRMLTSLLLSSSAKGLKGLCFGPIRPPKPREGEKPTPTFTIAEVLDDRCRVFGVPSFQGLPFGHAKDKLTLPLGVLAELDADNGTLTLLESAVH